MKTIVFDQPERIAQWVSDRIGHRFTGETFAVGLIDGDRVIAGMVLNQRKCHDIQGHVAADGGLTRKFLAACHELIFETLGVRRLTACCARSNAKSTEFMQRLGFAYEGCQRAGYANGEDRLMFGLLKEESKWHGSR